MFTAAITVDILLTALLFMVLGAGCGRKELVFVFFLFLVEAIHGFI